MQGITEENRWKKGKCEAKYWYTVGDVARLKGVTVQAVRQAIYRKQLVLSDLGSVIKYLE